MAAPTNPAPRGTRALIGAIMAALADIPEVNRKAAFKHATAAVKEKLTAQAEKAKAAARRAPRLPGAKRRAAEAAIRREEAPEQAAGAAPPRPARLRRKPVLLPGEAVAEE